MGKGRYGGSVVVILVGLAGALAMRPADAGCPATAGFSSNTGRAAAGCPAAAGFSSNTGPPAAEALAGDAGNSASRDTISDASAEVPEGDDIELTGAEFDLLETLALFAGGSSLSARVRASASGIGERVPRRSEILAVAEGPLWKVGWRSRGSDSWDAVPGAEAAAFLALGGGRSGVRALLGDFIPSYGMGLVAGGTSFSYPFASSYPFCRAGGAVGTTSLSGTGVRGGAVEIGRGAFEAMLIGGSARSAAEGGPRIAKRMVGGRIGIGAGRCAIGISSIDGLAGADLGWLAPSFQLRFEAAGRSFPSAGFVCGIRVRDVSTGAALLGYSVPAGSRAPLGMVDGEEIDGMSTMSGGVIVLFRRLPRGIALRCTASRRIVADGLRRKLRDEMRLELEKGDRRASGKLALLESRIAARDEMPCPPCFPADETGRRTVTATARLRCRRGECKVHLRMPFSDGISGALVSPAVSIEAVKRHCTVGVTAAWRRAFQGNPSFSYPEPAFPGFFPWRTVWGTGRSCSVIINIFNNALRISCKVRLEVGSPPDLSAMGSIGL